MKKISTTLALSALSFCMYAQPMIGGGFSGLAGINGDTYQKTTNIPDTTGGYPFVCASKDGATLFASSFGKKKLYFIDPSSFTITDSMSHVFYGISASNEPNIMFARTDSGLCRINTSTKTIMDSVSAPLANSITERPASKEVWVVKDNVIYVVDYSSGLSATSFALPSSVQYDYGVVKFSPGGSTAYKIASMSYKIYKIDAASKAVVDSAVSLNVTDLLVSHDSTKLFATSSATKKIYVLQTSNMALIDSIDCGTREPFDLFFHPTRPEIWVINHFKDSVTVLNETSYAQIAAFKTVSSPHGLAFGVGTTGVNKLRSSVPDIRIYPNPASNSISIFLPGGAEKSVLLCDNVGRAIKQFSTKENAVSIGISDLAPGLYYFAITQNNSSCQTLTWIKE